MYAYVYVCMYVCVIYIVYVHIFTVSTQLSKELWERNRTEEMRGEKRREERKHWNGGFHGFSLYAVLWSFAAHCLHFASQWLHQCCSLLLLPAWFYSALQLPACTALEWLRQRCSCCSCIGSSTLFRNSVLVVRIGVAASRWIQSLYVRWC